MACGAQPLPAVHKPAAANGAASLPSKRPNQSPTDNNTSSATCPGPRLRSATATAKSSFRRQRGGGHRTRDPGAPQANPSHEPCHMSKRTVAETAPVTPKDKPWKGAGSSDPLRNRWLETTNTAIRRNQPLPAVVQNGLPLPIVGRRQSPGCECRSQAAGAADAATEHRLQTFRTRAFAGRRRRMRSPIHKYAGTAMLASSSSSSIRQRPPLRRQQHSTYGGDAGPCRRRARLEIAASVKRARVVLNPARPGDLGPRRMFRIGYRSQRQGDVI